MFTKVLLLMEPLELIIATKILPMQGRTQERRKEIHLKQNVLSRQIMFS